MGTFLVKQIFMPTIPRPGTIGEYCGAPVGISGQFEKVYLILPFSAIFKGIETEMGEPFFVGVITDIKH